MPSLHRLWQYHGWFGGGALHRLSLRKTHPANRSAGLSAGAMLGAGAVTCTVVSIAAGEGAAVEAYAGLGPTARVGAVSAAESGGATGSAFSAATVRGAAADGEGSCRGSVW